MSLRNTHAAPIPTSTNANTVLSDTVGASNVSVNYAHRGMRQEREEERRRQNRECARRCRRKRKEELESLGDTVEKLRSRSATLRKGLQSLTAKLAFLDEVKLAMQNEMRQHSQNQNQKQQNQTPFAAFPSYPHPLGAAPLGTGVLVHNTTAPQPGPQSRTSSSSSSSSSASEMDAPTTTTTTTTHNHDASPFLQLDDDATGPFGGVNGLAQEYSQVFEMHEVLGSVITSQSDGTAATTAAATAAAGSFGDREPSFSFLG